MSPIRESGSSSYGGRTTQPFEYHQSQTARGAGRYNPTHSTSVGNHPDGLRSHPNNLRGVSGHAANTSTSPSLPTSSIPSASPRGTPTPPSRKEPKKRERFKKKAKQAMAKQVEGFRSTFERFEAVFSNQISDKGTAHWLELQQTLTEWRSNLLDSVAGDSSSISYAAAQASSPPFTAFSGEFPVSYTRPRVPLPKTIREANRQARAQKDTEQADRRKKIVELTRELAKLLSCEGKSLLRQFDLALFTPDVDIWDRVQEARTRIREMQRMAEAEILRRSHMFQMERVQRRGHALYARTYIGVDH